MHRPARTAFTLIELLVVITIISILVGISLPIFARVQLAGKKTQSLSNMRQLGTMLIGYCGDNNGELPTEGESNPTWQSAAATNATNATAWYDVLPRQYGNTRGVGDFNTTQGHSDFYSKASLFYVPAASYPSTKLNAPLFAVAFCSKIYDATYITNSITVRLANFMNPAETCIFQESGVPGEKLVFNNQSAYNGQSKSFASRSVTRYGGKTIIVFADGHADLLDGKDVVDPSSGKAYSPQSNGKVYWTMNPTLNANN